MNTDGPLTTRKHSEFRRGGAPPSRKVLFEPVEEHDICHHGIGVGRRVVRIIEFQHRPGD